MILDLDQFLEREQPFWDELQKLLKRNDKEAQRRMSLEEARRFHYLYQRASSDLVKLKTFAGDVEAKQFLENLVARAYGQLHSQRGRSIPFKPWEWLTQLIPQTFRRHWRAFTIATTVFWLGGLFGGFFVHQNYDDKQNLIGPFGHLAGDPSDRVAKEEAGGFDGFSGRQSFAAQLQGHNTKVSIRVLCWGVLFGIMTVIELFYNGLIIGSVSYDYIMAGETEFLIAWLLPHGSFELTAIFIAGQCGLIIAHAMFGWGTNLKLRQRLSRIRTDILTLLGLLALMLVWAGFVESFISQYHGSAFYKFKIAFGVVEMVFLIYYFGFCGRRHSKSHDSDSLPHQTPAAVA